MAIKKYTSGAWVPTNYRKYGTETDIITSLPAQIVGDGQPITSCQISGNTVQDGTPTPKAPVDVVGCGDIWNHWNGTLVRYRLGKSLNTKSVSYLENGAMFQIEAAPNVDYTVEQDSSPLTTLLRIYRSNNPLDYGVGAPILYDSMVEWNGTGTPKATINSGSFKYIWVQFGGTWYDSYGASATISLVGDYAISLICGGETSAIYLGQVPTTRRIKKLVLTGEETWRIEGGKDGVYSAPNANLGISVPIQPYAYQLSSHFALADRYSTIYYNTGYFTVETVRLIISYFAKQSVDDFKSYLAAQYAAGTPVTIWYVLAEPETAVVNEPLHKIGDYADTVTATNISTTGTPENFDVLTTLKPSEVQLTYHGWHEHTDTKYTE